MAPFPFTYGTSVTKYNTIKIEEKATVHARYTNWLSKQELQASTTSFPRSVEGRATAHFAPLDTLFIFM